MKIRCSLAVFAVCLAACAPTEPATPRPTAPVILLITPVATLDVDATATALVGVTQISPTPAGLYVVEPGDTLSGIAERFNTTVDDLIAANGLTDPNAIQAGQTLIIPSQLNSPPQLIGPGTTPTSSSATP